MFIERSNQGKILGNSVPTISSNMRFMYYDLGKADCCFCVVVDYKTSSNLMLNFNFSMQQQYAGFYAISHEIRTLCCDYVTITTFVLLQVLK